jgi:formylglycine-generating enzyme required for sulfatase activity
MKYAMALIGEKHGSEKTRMKLAMKTWFACAMCCFLLMPCFSQAAEAPPTAQPPPSTFTNSIGMRFVSIPSGTFMMGASKKIDGEDGEERPLHEVEISGFYLGQYEVTQQEWQAVMGELPAKMKSSQRGANNPVTAVSYDDVQAFISGLNQRESNGHYRLPTEAEWEYAARAGQTGEFPYGNDAAALSRYAWCQPGEKKNPQPVGGKAPNSFGLYDMLGNVWEWVGDGYGNWYDEHYYRNSPRVNPTGPASGDLHVVRGGGFGWDQSVCRVSYRTSFLKGKYFDDLGFRLAFVPKNGDSSFAAQQAAAQKPTVTAAPAPQPVAPPPQVVVQQAAASAPAVEVSPVLQQSQTQPPLSSFTNSIGMRLVYIPPGTFVMGASKKPSDAIPAHEVEISAGFYLGQYEVRQEEWQTVMGQLPANMDANQRGTNKPVTGVSYDDVQAFIGRLNLRETKGQYRLPTEAEWEYAARAGQTGDFPYGEDSDDLSRYAWIKQAKVGSPQAVGGKAPNPFGLYDMLGNVWEWVGDWYGESYYQNSPRLDPIGPASGDSRVIRGGGYGFGYKYCNVFYRYSSTPDAYSSDIGFRLAFVPKRVVSSSTAATPAPPAAQQAAAQTPATEAASQQQQPPPAAQGHKSGNTGKKRKSQKEHKQVVDTARATKSEKQSDDKLTQEDKDYDAIFSTGNKEIRRAQ